jgi:leucyl-tRNA synthetase
VSAAENLWIGRSEGVEVIFRAAESEQKIPVFTTRPDTLFGVTYMVLAPEHALVQELTKAEHKREVFDYVEKARRESEIQRTSTEKEKTGVFTGVYAINPINDERIPIWIADYVLLTYGTGAVMAVPAHDQRDFEFAKKYGLSIRDVILPEDREQGQELKEAFAGHGIMINSSKFNDLDSRIGQEKIADALEEMGSGRRCVNYKLRDWLISRQRYWGAPIPIVYCKDCGIVPVPEADLPVLLPKDVDFTPKGTGESPLAMNPAFVRTACPRCGAPGRREVDTMDTFVCSSWYFMRYLSPYRSESAFDPDLVKKWCPVDQYVGGAEHAVMHLLYARFVTKVLHDMGYIHFDEPFSRLVHQGTITKDGAKMSKSKGNVVSADQFIKQYGSDTFRMYLMFMGSYQDGGDWSDKGIVGISRFLNRIWRLVHQIRQEKSSGSDPFSDDLNRVMHYTIQQIGQDIDRFQFNTAISRLMEFVNALYIHLKETPLQKLNQKPLDEASRILVLLLSPFAPHLAEELWQVLGYKQSVFLNKWPSYDPKFLKKLEVTIVIQVNGKVRARIVVPADIADEHLKQLALQQEKVKAYTQNGVRRVIVVTGKLVNVVV